MKNLCLLFLPVFISSFTQEKYTIYHDVGSKTSLDLIKKHGLLTRNEQIRRRLCPGDTSSSNVRSDQYDVLYFHPSKPYGTSDNKLVGYQVDPQNTYVYNREFRVGDHSRYSKSKVPLLIYLRNKELGKQSSDKPQGGFNVVYDPYTSKPFYVYYADARYEDPLFNYWGEVIVERDNIPTEELIFFDKPKTLDLEKKLKQSDKCVLL